MVLVWVRVQRVDDNMRGIVFNIDRLAVHDGPGIRTMVYMKGCPLSCVWCSTPESQRATPEILYLEVYCKKCGRCVEACTLDAMTLYEDGVRIDRSVCTDCGACAEACPNRAMRLVGDYITVEELLKEVEKYRLFYRRSNGGVTIGGGEPMMQPEFVTEFLKMCKQRYLHTALETCGHVSWEHMENLLRYLDILYFDIKHLDPVVHKELTGVSNELILENATRASILCPMIVRIPTVPGYNDSEENIKSTAEFAARLRNVKRIELLPYHGLGVLKYGRLGREYEIRDVHSPGDDYMKRLKEIVESCGVSAQIGG